MRLALDAMGGDAAPREPVCGAVQAARAFPETEIILVGDEKELRRSLDEARADAEALGFEIHHAPERIEMGEAPVDAIRGKPDSSLAQCVRLVAEGKADVAVSAGSTGAFVAGATLGLRLLEGVRRPGIAITAPTVDGGHVTIIDMGASVQCKPTHLFQYAVMASIYHQYVVGAEEPRVGLLNVGAEEGKGPALTKDVFGLLEASRLNFIGNVEGGDIHQGKCDVIVCDGFVGNVLLKALEGIGEMFLGMFLESRSRGIRSRLGLSLLRPVLKDIAEGWDFAEYGGAPLLGVEGECIICHGRSDARAFKNAVGAALAFHQHHVNEHIIAAIAAEQETLARFNNVRANQTS